MPLSSACSKYLLELRRVVTHSDRASPLWLLCMSSGVQRHLLCSGLCGSSSCMSHAVALLPDSLYSLRGSTRFHTQVPNSWVPLVAIRSSVKFSPESQVALASCEVPPLPQPDVNQVHKRLVCGAVGCQVTFDPREVTYERLLSEFFQRVDPTTKNRQACRYWL